jgi:hypothetical protein
MSSGPVWTVLVSLADAAEPVERSIASVAAVIARLVFDSVVVLSPPLKFITSGATVIARDVCDVDSAAPALKSKASVAVVSVRDVFEGAAPAARSIASGLVWIARRVGDAAAAEPLCERSICIAAVVTVRVVFAACAEADALNDKLTAAITAMC